MTVGLLSFQVRKHRLAVANFQLHWARDGIYFRIVIFIDAGPEGPGANRILRAQTKLQRYRVAWQKRIEVQNRLSSRQTELFQPSAFLARTLFAVSL